MNSRNPGNSYNVSPANRMAAITYQLALSVKKYRVLYVSLFKIPQEKSQEKGTGNAPHCSSNFFCTLIFVFSLISKRTITFPGSENTVIDFVIHLDRTVFHHRIRVLMCPLTTISPVIHTCCN